MLCCFFFFLNSFLLIMLCLLGLKEVKSSIIFDWIAHYRCLQYRASSDSTRLACNCTVRVNHSSDQSVIRSEATHVNCGEALKRARLSDISDPAAFLNGTIHDIVGEIIDRCKARAIEFTSLSAQNISDTVAHEYDLLYNGRMMATYATRDQLKRAVYSARHTEFGGDSFSIIKAPPLAHPADDDPRYFFAQIQRMIGWLGKSGSFVLGSGKWLLSVDDLNDP